MENLLNTIEESENNNPLLTAALLEVERLTVKIEEIKSVAYGSNFSYSDEESRFNTVALEEENSHKVEIIQSLVMFR